MGSQKVKNTIVERLMQIAAPHLCYGCGQIGVPLCLDCKYNIIAEPFYGCIGCAKPTSIGVCDLHHKAVTRAWVVSTRQDVLKALIHAYKFSNLKAAGRSLAELLQAHLPILPSNVIIVPIPTVTSHIRTRGYDHAGILAVHFSDLASLPLQRILRRVTTSTQHFVGRAERQLQAGSAFALAENIQIQAGAIYVLVDDVVTTGSTLFEAAKVIQKAGGTVWAAALAYQPSTTDD